MVNSSQSVVSCETCGQARNQHTKESLNNLIALYEAWNKPEKAKEWRAKLEQIKAVEE